MSPHTALAEKLKPLSLEIVRVIDCEDGISRGCGRSLFDTGILFSRPFILVHGVKKPPIFSRTRPPVKDSQVDIPFHFKE